MTVFYVTYSVIDPSTDNMEVIYRAAVQAQSQLQASKLVADQKSALINMLWDDETWYGQAFREEKLTEDDVYTYAAELASWTDQLSQNWFELTEGGKES